MIQAKANTAPSEKRIIFMSQIEVTKWFITTDIKRTDNERPAPDRLSNLPISDQLFFFGGCACPIQEQELGSEQPDPFGPIFQRKLRIVRSTDVGDHLDNSAILGGGR